MNQLVMPVAASLVLSLSPVATAQQNAAPAETVQVQTADGTTIVVGGGATYGFETDIDNGGNLEITTVGAGVALAFDLTENIRVKSGFDYIYSNYDFTDAASFGGDPWEEIHDLQLGVNFDYAATSDLTVFGGPVFAIVREDGTDWDDGFVGGARAGAALRVDSGLTIGGGVVVTSQIEDSAYIFPLIVLDWDIGGGYRLTTRTGTNPGIYGNVLELVYEASEDWTFGLGAAYQYRRFRLDDEGIAPDGVGQHTQVPLWLRATWRPTPQVSLTGRVGAAFMSELRLEDDGGSKINETDTDPIYLVGASLTVRF